jgi:outer membrane receptor for monomeric catechols
MRVQNEITFDPFTFANVNFERTRHAGIEASVAGQALSWLSLYARYTLDDVEIEKDQDPRIEHHRMPITPLQRGTFGFLATLPGKLEFAGNLNVVGDRLLSNDFDHQLPKLDPYAVLDLLLAWRPVVGKHLSGALTLAVRNVNGEKYSDFGARFDQFDPGSGGFVPTAFYNPAATRTWEVGFAVTVTR